MSTFDARLFVGPAPATFFPLVEPWRKVNGENRDDALGVSEPPRPELNSDPPRLRFIPGPEFMAAGAAEPAVLVPRIAYEGCVSGPHGRPRSLKSLSWLAGCVEAAAGLRWWGMYAPVRPLRVGLLLEEDGAALLRQRLEWIMRGLGLDRLPDTLRLIVRSGLNLEAPSERAEFLRYAVEPEGLDLLLIDPTRSPFPGVDGGPKDGAQLRRFSREGLDVVRSVALVHHDTKPGRDGQDGRVRAEQSSGGQFLSVADVPIGFSRLSGRSALAEWSLVKIGPDGGSLRLDVESGTADDGGFADYLRIVARPADPEDVSDTAERERIRAVLKADPWRTPSEIAQGAGLKRETVERLLFQLAAVKLARMETGAGAAERGRHKNAKLWGPFDE